VVEHNLAKVGVAGSSPVSRSGRLSPYGEPVRAFFFKNARSASDLFLAPPEVGRLLVGFRRNLHFETLRAHVVGCRVARAGQSMTLDEDDATKFSWSVEA
jgi:hypothetical protein